MKKTLLLSVVASVAVMAGGDIAPVPVVEPVVQEVSGWEFSGQAAVWYQTGDYATLGGRLNGATDVDLFDQDGARADFGLQLRAVNKDVFAGIGFGGEVSGLSTLNLENGVVSDVMQGTGNAASLLGGTADVDDLTDGGWISQLYLTYGFGNTSIKAGRQELPKALSPFAFSEKWNVFSNTFDSILVVNTDITDTTLVGAWVYGGNSNGIGVGADLTDFNDFNNDDGIYLLTAQNKSIEGLTLTGSWYYAPDLTGDDAHILWGDANYATANYYGALQGGAILLDTTGTDDTTAIGVKVGGNFDMFDASLAYSSVDDGTAGVYNFGGVKTPLYTQMILNQGAIGWDSDTFVARAGIKALGGKFGLAYDYSDTNDASAFGDDYTEVDFTYKTKVFNGSTTLFAGYIYQDADAWNDSRNTLRFWGKYNF